MISLFSEILVWLRSLPTAVWSTAGGSAVTLIGVLFSDWRNTRRLVMQHGLTSKEADKARLAATRKDVYLSAAGVLARMQEYLIILPTIKDLAGSSAPVDFAELVGKISMIGEAATVILAQQLASDYIAVQADLTKLAASARKAGDDATLYREYREKAVLQVERIHSEIAKFLESGVVNDTLFGAMQRSQTKFQEQAQKYWADEVAALERVSGEIVRYSVKALTILEPTGEASANLLIAIRAELGQSTNAADLLRAMKQNRDRSFQRIKEFAESVERESEAAEYARQEHS
jgi:hypothetical protein